MTDIQEEEQKQELSPAALKVQRKMRNLLIGSTLVMFLGFIAVFAAILYKITDQDSSDVDSEQSAATTETSRGAKVISTIEIGPGAKVRSAHVENGKVFVLVDDENGTSLHILDAKNGTPSSITNFVNR